MLQKQLFDIIVICVKMKVRMIKKYHNHTMLTNPLHRDEEPQNINSNKTSER